MRDRLLTRKFCEDEWYAAEEIFTLCTNKERFYAVESLTKHKCSGPRFTYSNWWGPTTGPDINDEASPILGSSEDVREDGKDYGLNNFCLLDNDPVRSRFLHGNPAATSVVSEYSQCIKNYHRLLMVAPYDECDNLLWLNCLITNNLPKSQTKAVILVTAPKNTLTAPRGECQTRAVDEYCYLNHVCDNKQALWDADDEDTFECELTAGLQPVLSGHDRGKERPDGEAMPQEPCCKAPETVNLYDSMFR